MAGSLQPGRATGIGSVPHTDARAAAEWVVATLSDLPFVPQLARCGETMLATAANGVRGVGVTDSRLSVDIDRLDPLAEVSVDLGHPIFGALRAFAETAKGRKGPIKWQHCGPITFGLQLVRYGASPKVAFEVAVRAVRQQLVVIQSFLRTELPNCEQLVFLDEPGLVTMMCPGFPLSPDTTIDVVSGALAAIDHGAVMGVHCCGDADWSAVLASGPAVLSLPVVESLAAAAGCLAAFVDRGGWVAWGAVPTDRPIGSSSDHWWRELAALWCALAQAGCDPVRLRTQALITPACGLAHHDLAQADLILRLTQDVAARVHDQATATRLSVGA